MRSDRYKDEPVKKKKRGILKPLLITILLLAAAVGAATAYFYKTAYDSLALTFTEESPVIDFGEERRSMDYVKESGGEITPASEYLKTDETGKLQMKYTAEQPVLGGLLTPSKEFTLSYTVVDTEPPLKLRSGDGSVVLLGSGFDINSIISYGDYADPNPELKVDGEVNTDEVGDYPLHVSVTDASGNTAEWDLTVSVIEEMPDVSYESESTEFADFVAANKGKGKTFGIDISAWQDEVNFKALKKAGCEFVIIRIGYTYEEELNIDKRFLENIEGAKKAGLRTGIYYYSTDNTEEEVRYAADWIRDTLDGYSPDLPIAFDWEEFENYQNFGMSLYELNKLYDAFADELGKSGYGCMLYGSKTYLENIWEKTDSRPVWLAHYTEKTDYKGPYMLWQASSTGRISGISGDVDMDILYSN